MSGKFRTHNVIITGLDKALPDYRKVPQLRDNLNFWLQEKIVIDIHPLVKACQAHKRLVSIHPFSDGNRKTARLLMNTILLQNGCIQVCIPPIKRNDYISTLRNYQEGKCPFSSLIEVIASIELQTQKDFMRLMLIQL